MFARPLKKPDSELWLDVAAAVVVCLAYVVMTERLAEDLRTLSRVVLFAAILFAPRLTLSWQPWAAMATILVVGVFMLPFDVPNHHFVLAYVTLALAIALSAPETARASTLRWNARWLLVAIMGFATLHKVISPAFMDGSYLAYVLATGGFGAPVLALCHACGAAAVQNASLVGEFRAALPASEAAVMLAAPLPNLAVAGRAFAWAIVAGEALLFLAFLVAPSRRVSHIFLLVFAATLGVIRQEFLFISVLCLLGLLSCSPRMVWLRRAYAAAALVFAAGAIS